MFRKYKLVKNGVVLGTAMTMNGLKKIGRKHSEYMFSLDAPFYKSLKKGTHNCFLDDQEATVVVS